MSGLLLKGVVRPNLPGPIDLIVEPASICALCGPNGAGKTTLMRAAAGLTEGPGTVTLTGAPLTALSRTERAGRLAYLPADRRAEWPLLVRDVVALGLARRDEDAVSRVLERTETTDFQHRRLDTLSTGERARVLLARVLAPAPDILLLDEPTANLDPAHQLSIMALLHEEAARGAAVLLAVHDLILAREHADDAILLSEGHVAASGPAAEALSDENIARVFGVRADPAGGFWVRA